MRPYTSLAQESNMRVKAFQTEDVYVLPNRGTFTRSHLEPISTWEVTKYTIEMVDAN